MWCIAARLLLLLLGRTARGAPAAFGVAAPGLPADAVRALGGMVPQSFTGFWGFPMRAEDTPFLNTWLQQARGYNASVVLSLEPFGGLSTVTSSSCTSRNS